MLKMILADDEPVITYGIRNLVDWQSFGVQIIGTYDDGKAAFNAIVNSAPDIAVLDISMPEKTGIDILADISKMKINTKVIFLSGFQDFKYAQAALKYGAVEYLLKPVKKDSLLKAVAKCMTMQGVQPHRQFISEKNDTPLGRTAYQKIIGLNADSYTLLLCELILQAEKPALETELVKFSAASVVENFLASQNIGTSFWHGKQCCVVFKTMEKEALLQNIKQMRTLLKQHCDISACFAVSGNIKDITQIPVLIEENKHMLECFYFYPQIIGDTVFADDLKYDEPQDVITLSELRDKLLEKVIAQDIAAAYAIVKEYLYKAGIAAQGNKQAAVYFAISCVRYVDSELKKRLATEEILVSESEMFERLHETQSYENLQAIVELQVEKLLRAVAECANNSAKTDVIKAMQYIDEHYAENLSLEVLAKHVHMNSFYFSSFFKKQTGKNFKDYINEVRMARAMELLMTANFKSYEIAEKVGFKDYRYFTELFSKFYGKTPAAYKKSIIKDDGNK